jgi:hypothetical protein
MRPIASLRPSKRNARTHTQRQRKKLAAAVRRFGFINPILIDQNGEILAGHLRYQVACGLGLELVPVIEIAHLSEAEKRAFALAENRIALDAGWDRETLAIELGELAVLLPDSQIDIANTGFEISEAEIIINHRPQPQANAADAPVPLAEPRVTRRDDLWTLGRHRLLCGDPLDPQSYATIMRGKPAHMAFVDPRFDPPIESLAPKNGAVSSAEAALASGSTPTAADVGILERAMGLLADACGDGSVAYVCSKERDLRQLLDAGCKAFGEPENICISITSNGRESGLYRSAYETICVFTKGTLARLNSLGPGQAGRVRTNVWRYPGVNPPKAGRRARGGRAILPIVRPAKLVADAMRDGSHEDSIVLDPFIGAGTTIIAGETVGRRVYGMDIDPRYVDAAVRRWQQFTGRNAVLEGSGETFDQVTASRTGDPDLGQSAAHPHRTSLEGDR